MTDIKDEKLLHGKDLSDHLKNVAEKEEKEKRTEVCRAEILEVLKKHDCDLDAFMIIGRNGNSPQVSIVAKDKK